MANFKDFFLNSNNKDCFIGNKVIYGQSYYWVCVNETGEDPSDIDMERFMLLGQLDELEENINTLEMERSSNEITLKVLRTARDELLKVIYENYLPELKERFADSIEGMSDYAIIHITY